MLRLQDVLARLQYTASRRPVDGPIEIRRVATDDLRALLAAFHERDLFYRLHHGRALTLQMKGCYFDQIAAGEKLWEYRLASARMTNRLVDRDYDRIVLTRGYPRDGGTEGKDRLTLRYRGYEPRVIQHEHFGPDPVQVFAIDVSGIIS